MDKAHPGRQYIDPRLLALIDKSEEEEILDVKSLRKDDVISLQTRNTTYTMEVVDPEKGQVVVNSNGRHVTESTKGMVIGTTLTGTGTMIKLQTIILNLRLCLFVEGKGELILSAVQGVSVNGTKMLPIDKSKNVN